MWNVLNETVHRHVYAVAYLGGHWAMPPPLWPEHENFLNTLNQKKFFNFWGGAQLPPQTPSSVGRGHPLPTLHSIGASGASNLASLALPPLHKILNTPLCICCK